MCNLGVRPTFEENELIMEVHFFLDEVDNLYGKDGDMHKHFNHDDFAKECDKRTSKILVSYNNSQLIKDRFKNWCASEYSAVF